MVGSRGASEAVPVVRLTEVFRQAAQSRVIVNAHRINRGENPELAAVDGSDFYFVDAAEPDEVARKLVTVVRERIPARFGLDPIRDVQVLCPMNRGAAGARALNLALQAALNPPTEARIERFGWIYGPGVALSLERRIVPVPLSPAVWNETFEPRYSQFCRRNANIACTFRLDSAGLPRMYGRIP